MRRTGFTLVELLVVIAIVGVLAAMLFPVLAQARAQARTTVCVSNEHQIGLAIALYAEDDDEELPDLHSDPMCAGRGYGPVYWHDHFCRCFDLAPRQPSYYSEVQPYIRESDLAVAYCPSDTGWTAATSYEYKLWLADGRKLADVPAPSGMALLWEEWAFHVTDGHLSEYDRRSAMNIAFVDGHVKWKRLADTTTARYGSGPDLHGLFRGSGPSDPLYGLDFVP